MKVDLAKLKEFKHEASSAGYESENPKHKIIEKDKSKTIFYTSGDWKYQDNYFGGEPYGGRTVIFYKDNPIWMTIYYGWADKSHDVDEVYSFLRKALRQKNEDGFRGPKEFTKGNFTYKNSWKGTIDNYSGVEEIWEENKLIYSTIYAGGLVDQRVGE